MRTLALIIAAIVAVPLAKAQSSFFRAEELQEKCKAVEGNPAAEEEKFGDAMFCAGYFMALVNWNHLETALGNPVLFCPPSSGISGTQAIKVFMKYATDHPADLSQPAEIMVLSSLGSAFLCPREQTEAPQ